MTTASQGIWWPLLDSMGLSAHVCIPTQRHIYSTHIHIIQDKPKKIKNCGRMLHWLRGAKATAILRARLLWAFSSWKVAKGRGRTPFITNQGYIKPWGRHLHWIFPAVSSRYHYPCSPDEERTACRVCFSEATQLNKQTLKIWTKVLSDFKLMFHRLKIKTKQSTLY